MAENFIHGDLAVISVIQEQDINTAPHDWNSSTTCIEVKEWSVKPEITMVEKTRYGKTHKAPGSAPGKRVCEIEFEIPLPGMAVKDVGTPIIPPEFSALMLAAGFNYTMETLGDGTSASGVITVTDDTGALTTPGEHTVTILTHTFDLYALGLENSTATEIATALASEIDALQGFSAVASGNTVTVTRDEGGVSGNSVDFTSEGDILEVSGSGTLLGGVDPDVNTVTFLPATLKCGGAPSGGSNPTGQSTCSIRLFAFKDGACVGQPEGSGVYMVEANGVKLNAELTLTSEDESVIKFSGRGFYKRPVETDINIIPAYQASDDSLVAQSGNVMIDGHNEFVSNFELNMGFEVGDRPSIGGIGGLGGFVLHRSGSPGGSFDSEASMDDIAPGGFWDKLEGGEQTDIFIRVTSAQGVHVSVHIPNGQLESPDSSLEGVMKYSKPFKARDLDGSGDNYVGIKFTTDLEVADSPIFTVE